MLNRPCFKQHYRVELSDNGVILLSEGDAVVLDGRLHRLVAPFIDGQRTADEIAQEVAHEASAADVFYALAHLEQRGHIAESTAALPPGEAALWSIQGLDVTAAATRLESTTVSVRTLGDFAAAPIHEALRLARLQVVSDGVRPDASDAADLCIVVTDDYLRRDLEEINQQALRSGKPWLLMRPSGIEIWLGPMFRPGVTGCYECLAYRLRSNRLIECHERERQGWPEPFSVARAQTAATQQLAYSMLAVEVAGLVARGSSTALDGKVLSMDLRSWAARTHTLVRRPQCPICGDPRPRTARPIELASTPYSFAQDGGYRSVSAETTLARYQHHISPITGALVGVERLGPSSDGVTHVFLAGPNISRSAGTSFAIVRNDLRNKNSGKGTSDLFAQVSAMCEGLERYSAVFIGDEPRQKARMRELGAAAVHPNDCMLYSARQFAEREVLNARIGCLDYVPVPFDPDALIEWTPVYSLTHREFRYLPTAFCYFAYPLPGQQPYCTSCSTGNAAGNTIEEAILQGFFELAERDAVSMWWYCRLRRPAVDLASFDEPYVQRLQAVYAARHRDLWVLDLTNDLGVPVFAAISRRNDEQPERILIGFGAHFDPRIALLRAVTELNQMLAMFMPDIGDELPPEKLIDSPITVQWLRTATLASEPYLVPHPALPPKHLPQQTGPRPSRRTGDLRTDIERCQQIVERAGLEMLVLDQTRPDIGLPVVKVIVPGIRHFWARFAPGRLYDVPLRLGWVDRPLREDELNPKPVFI